MSRSTVRRRYTRQEVRLRRYTAAYGLHGLLWIICVAVGSAGAAMLVLGSVTLVVVHESLRGGR